MPDIEWPVEIEELSKGDEIGPEVLSPWFGEDFGTNRYQLLLSNFVEKLSSALVAIGKRYVLRCRQGSAAILTDQEAAIYTQERFGAHFRGLHRSNLRAKYVDQRQLDAGERRRHEHSLLVQGAILHGADDAKKKVEPTVYQRRNPSPVILAMQGE